MTKPLKTRDSGTLGVAEIPCLRLGLCYGSMGAVATHGHSGQKSDTSVTTLTPVVVILTPPLVRLLDPSKNLWPRSRMCA